MMSFQDLLTEQQYFLLEITKKHPFANIVVDEFPVQLINPDIPLCYEEFRGNMWIASSSVSKYDFKEVNTRDQDVETQLAKGQNFIRTSLSKNMRNGRQILTSSFRLHEDNIIERGLCNQEQHTAEETKQDDEIPSQIINLLNGQNTEP